MEGIDPGFVGEAYEAPMLLQDAQRCINWYCEISEDKTNGSKMPIALLGCPGLNLVASVGNPTQIRGQWTLPGNTSALVVGGNILYLLTVAIPATTITPATLALTQVGTLLTSTGPVSIRDNGVIFGGKGGYAVIVDGQFGYYYLLSGQQKVVTFTGGVSSGTPNITVSPIPNGVVAGAAVTVSDSSGFIPANTLITGANFNTPSLTMSQNATNTNASDTITITIPVFGQITDTAFLPASMVAFIEGWLIFSQPGTRTFFTNATTPYTLLFAGSFFALKDSSTDNLVTLYENNRELWLIGERTSEVWYNAGNPNFAFTRIPSIGPQIGCAATHSITRLGPDLVWLARNEQGQNIVVRQVNYQWERISTHAIDHAIASYPVVNDAIGFAYEEEGHWFYVLTFPTADATWVYDGKTKMWHQRGAWDITQGIYHRFRANAFCDLADMRLVGDYQNGNIYQMSRLYYTDGGNVLRCQRRAPHVWSKQNRKRLFHSQMQIEFTPGVGQSLPGSPQNTTGYTANAWYNNGVAWLSSSGLTGAAASKQGTLSVWLKANGLNNTNAQVFVISGTGNNGLLVFIDTGNFFHIQGFTSSGLQMEFTSGSPLAVSSGYINILASWDLNSNSKNLYINNANSISSGGRFFNIAIDLTGTSSVFAASNGVGITNISLSEVWFNPTYIDFSQASNRALFNVGGFPANLGSTGQTPTGATPLVYLNSALQNLNMNKGTGGNYTINNTFLTANSPSAYTPLVTSPQAMLRWYDYNNNKNWSNEHWRSIGKIGEVTNRAIWRVLGTSRDRIYELNFSDAVPRDIIGATLFVEPEDESETQLMRSA